MTELKLSEVEQLELQAALEEAKVTELAEGKTYLIVVERNNLSQEGCWKLQDELRHSLKVPSVILRVNDINGLRVFELEKWPPPVEKKFD